ncbi:MAG: DUF4158 domain-containing protein [Actinomycetota bacterium]|nr:DUF4158 domain-containing protein [Actinomycetota bacterium]
MTSIERTAYPRFGRLVTARELTAMSPTPGDVGWARERSRSDAHLLARMVSLKCCQRLGYFPRPDDVPEAVVDHVRRCLDLAETTAADAGSDRTAESHRQLVRERLGVAWDRERARAVAEGAIRAAAEMKNHPPDLINVALELVVKASLELFGFSTLNEMSARIRAEVNAAIFERIVGRITDTDMARLDGLLVVTGPARKSGFNRLKQSAGKASWSAFLAQVEHLGWSTRWATRADGWRGWPRPRSWTSRARRRPVMRRSWAMSPV